MVWMKELGGCIEWEIIKTIHNVTKRLSNIKIEVNNQIYSLKIKNGIYELHIRLEEGYFLRFLQIARR